MEIPLSFSRTDQTNSTGTSQHFLRGFLAFLQTHLGDTDSILHTACGPVVLKKRSKNFIGAKHFSSSVGEAPGVIEALLYLLSVVEAAKK